MRTTVPAIVLCLISLGAVAATEPQLPDPLPAPVEKRGLTVQIRDLARLPDTRGVRPPDQDTTPPAGRA